MAMGDATGRRWHDSPGATGDRIPGSAPRRIPNRSALPRCPGAESSASDPRRPPRKVRHSVRRGRHGKCPGRTPGQHGRNDARGKHRPSLGDLNRRGVGLGSTEPLGGTPSIMEEPGEKDATEYRRRNLAGEVLPARLVHGGGRRERRADRRGREAPRTSDVFVKTCPVAVFLRRPRLSRDPCSRRQARFARFRQRRRRRIVFHLRGGRRREDADRRGRAGSTPVRPG